MAEGVWVLLGTFLGSAGSLATTWLTAYLGRQSKHPKFDRAVEDLLRRMLQQGPRWRRLSTLARVTGLSEQHTKEYLVEIGARGSEIDDEVWGLISRNPLKDIVSPAGGEGREAIAAPLSGQARTGAGQ